LESSPESSGPARRRRRRRAVDDGSTDATGPRERDETQERAPERGSARSAPAPLDRERGSARRREEAGPVDPDAFDFGAGLDEAPRRDERSRGAVRPERPALRRRRAEREELSTTPREDASAAARERSETAPLERSERVRRERPDSAARSARDPRSSSESRESAPPLRERSPSTAARSKAPAPAQTPTDSRQPSDFEPSQALRETSFVQLLRSSRCDERGALVVDVRLPRRDHMEPNALRVIGRLAREGYEAYLVGGCVRDLLLGRRPKDFDVATEAHPREIKRLFRNGRIIGRRFKLVHVVYGPDVVETSTFRAPPRSHEVDAGEAPTVDDLLIVDDNEFGTAAEDARRRDFTINGLFLDPIENEIIDYVDGLEDLSARVLRTIGDPRVRIAEDPVRILRAVKFAARLGFRIHPATWDAMVEHGSGLARSAAPRVVEEILRLLQSGHSAHAFGLLEDCGALRVLLPALARWRAADRSGAGVGWSVLSALDERIQRGEAPSTGFCLAALFVPAFVASPQVPNDAEDEELDRDGQAIDLASDLLEPLARVARLSRRDVGTAKRLLANQWRLVAPQSRRFRPLVFVRTPEFEDSLDLLALCARAGAADPALVDRWRARRDEARSAAPEDLEPEVAPRRKRRRRRRRGHGGT
jgi:poly(A) polymerase